ncbi:MAG: NTP transferase domain-containing protein [Deltaproteobacteria bacterium]|nr:NTP transferase domain-containing protein [Deltaproteobacteria bacterium]
MIRSGESVAGIVLAAGESTRTLLERILDEALRSDLDEVILVLGHLFEDIRAVLGQVLEHPKLKVIQNRQYKQGISSSIIAGLSEVEESHDHVMILLADMPHIDANLIDLLVRRYIDSRLPLGAIKLKTKRTHPVIFSRKLNTEKPLKRDECCTCLGLLPFVLKNRNIHCPEHFVELWTGNCFLIQQYRTDRSVGL